MSGHLVTGVLLWFCVSLVVGLDARKNSPQNAFLWGLAVFTGVLPILLVYVLLGRDTANGPRPDTASASELVECPNCHAMENSTRSVCRFCNEPM
jgi:hypothetical protein